MTDTRYAVGPLSALARYVACSIAVRVMSFAGFLVVWWCVSTLFFASLPTPGETASELLELARPVNLGHGLETDPSIWRHAMSTAARSYGGLVIALLVFVPIGILIGTTKSAYASSVGLIEFGRSVPAFMLILVLLNLRISGEWARMTCIVFAVGILLTDYTATAMRRMPREQTDVLKAVGASGWQLFTKVHFIPLVTEAVLPTMRIGVGVSLIVCVVVETLVQPDTGIGMVLTTKLGKVSVAGGLALVVVVGVLGWIGNLTVSLSTDIIQWIYSGRPLSVI